MSLMPHAGAFALTTLLILIRLCVAATAPQASFFPFQVEKVVCIFLLKDLQYKPLGLGGEEAHACELVDRSNRNKPIGHIYDLVGLNLEQANEKLISGVSKLVVEGARINEGKVYIPQNSRPIIITEPGDANSNRRRQPASITGNRTILVVRVVAPDSSTTMSMTELSDNIFGTSGDPVNLVTQFAACSYDKLQFIPTADNRALRGVYEVNISTPVLGVNEEIVREAVSAQVSGDLGDLASQFDYVMYCLPRGTASRHPGATDWSAYGYTNSWLSVYNDDYCKYVSILMHDVGHNLGLGHSGEGYTGMEAEYGDRSCMMGFSENYDDWPKMCYNGAKSWQLGWYSDRHATATPFTLGWSGRLVGVSDYGNSDGYAVILKLESGHPVDYYVTFNRKNGVNSEMREGGDQVLITKQGWDGERFPSKSTLIAKLSAGETYEISKFGGDLEKVEESVNVTVNSINMEVSPPYADITVSRAACWSDAQCDDGDPCTNGFCNAEGWCEHTPIANCCGDYICDQLVGEETCGSCPEDCCFRRTLATAFNADNWNRGNMFDVVAQTEILVTGFDVHIAATSEVEVKVFTREGSYIGFEYDRTEWKLILSATIRGAGSGFRTSLPDLRPAVTIRAGATQSFYVTVVDGYIFKYTLGISEGSVFVNNSDLAILEGISRDYPFENPNVWRPRVWNGIIRYSRKAVLNEPCADDDECQPSLTCRKGGRAGGVCVAFGTALTPAPTASPSDACTLGQQNDRCETHGDCCSGVCCNGVCDESNECRFAGTSGSSPFFSDRCAFSGVSLVSVFGALILAVLIKV